MATTTATTVVAAVVSPWGKAGAWARDSEEKEEEQRQEAAQPLPDFPSLSAAQVTKTKKKKPQSVSLSEFTKPDLFVLPTGPRERSAEEIQHASSRSYGRSTEDTSSRWGSSNRDRNEPPRRTREPPAPSKADETDDWAAAKKSAPPRDRGGFFESHSRADESDTWLSKKSSEPPRRRTYGGRGGFETNAGAASDTWGNEEARRPRLVLQPRSLPVSNGEQPQQSGSVTKSNPFGAARPREEVLAQKGQDWKKLDEQIDTTKVKDGAQNDHLSSLEDLSWRKTSSVDPPTSSK